jgi:hypothetical protein
MAAWAHEVNKSAVERTQIKGSGDNVYLPSNPVSYMIRLKQQALQNKITQLKEVVYA